MFIVYSRNSNTILYIFNYIINIEIAKQQQFTLRSCYPIGHYFSFTSATRLNKQKFAIPILTYSHARNIKWYYHRFQICAQEPVSLQSKTVTARRSLISPQKMTFPYAVKTTQILHIFYVFCGFTKLKVLNLRLFYRSQNLRLHFSTV